MSKATQEYYQQVLQPGLNIYIKLSSIHIKKVYERPPDAIILSFHPRYCLVLFLHLTFLHLVHGPLDRPPHTLFQADNGLVPQPPLCLVDTKVPRHARVDNPLPVKCRVTSKNLAHNLTAQAHKHAHIPRYRPHMLQPMRTPRRVPDQAAEIPKVCRTVIGNDKYLAIDFFMVERLCRGCMSQQQGMCGEEVAVCHVLDIGPVKEVIVGADLETGFTLEVNVDDVVLGLDVAFADNAGRTDRGGEEVCVVGAVGFEDNFFCCGLCL